MVKNKSDFLETACGVRRRKQKTNSRCGETQDRKSWMLLMSAVYKKGCTLNMHKCVHRESFQLKMDGPCFVLGFQCLTVA